MGLPPLSPWLQLGEGLHRHAFYTYVRDRTMRPRLGALSLTAAVLAAMSGGDILVTALAAASVSAAMPTPAGDAAHSLCMGALLGSLWHLVGILRSCLALLCAVALVQCAAWHQMLLPLWPVLPALISSVAPLVLLILHPACAKWPMATRIAFCTVLELGVLVHLVLGYAARTIWLNEWLLQHFAPALFQEVCAERKALRQAAKSRAKRHETPACDTTPQPSAVERGLVVVVGLPRSGTTYLFSLLERIHGDSGIALSCYNCLFHERCLVHCNHHEGGAQEVAWVESLIDSYFKDIGLPTRLIDEIPATAKAAEEYLHWLMPRYDKRRLDINPHLSTSAAATSAAAAAAAAAAAGTTATAAPFETVLDRMTLVAETCQQGPANAKGDDPARKLATAAGGTTPTHWTLLHKNPEECDAVALYKALPPNTKLIYIERDRAAVMNSLIRFFSQFFELDISQQPAKSQHGGFGALNPYYSLFAAALLKPGAALPSCLLLGASWRCNGLEVALAIARLLWLALGATKMKGILANALVPAYLARYAELRRSVASPEIPDGAIHSVRYDQLLAQPEMTLQGIADFLAVEPAFDLASVVPSPRPSKISAEVAAAMALPQSRAIEEELLKTDPSVGKVEKGKQKKAALPKERKGRGAATIGAID